MQSYQALASHAQRFQMVRESIRPAIQISIGQYFRTHRHRDRVRRARRSGTDQLRNIGR